MASRPKPWKCTLFPRLTVTSIPSGRPLRCSLCWCTSTWSWLTVTAPSGSCVGRISASGMDNRPPSCNSLRSPLRLRAGLSKTRASGRSATSNRSPCKDRSTLAGHSLGSRLPVRVMVPSPRVADPLTSSFPRGDPFTSTCRSVTATPRTGTRARPLSSRMLPFISGWRRLPPSATSPRISPLISRRSVVNNASGARLDTRNATSPVREASASRPCSRVASTVARSDISVSSLLRRRFCSVPCKESCSITSSWGASGVRTAICAPRVSSRYWPRGLSSEPCTVASPSRLPCTANSGPSRAPANGSGRALREALASI